MAAGTFTPFAWTTIVSNPYTVDSPSPILDPDSSIDNTEDTEFEIHPRIRELAVRLMYDDTPSTDAKIQPFGKRSSSQEWERLFDTSLQHIITLTTDATNDASDGTNQYTEPVLVVVFGFQFIRIGMHTAYDGSSDNESRLQARVAI